MKIKGFVFITVWAIVGVMIAVIASRYRDGRTAMVAEVESRVAAISLPKSVKVDSIYVLPGQSVSAGQPMVRVSRMDMDLEISKAYYELDQVVLDSLQSVQEQSNEINLLRLDYDRKRQELEFKLRELDLIKKDEARSSQLVDQLLNRETTTTREAIQLKIDFYKNEIDLLTQHWQSELKLLRQASDTRQKMHHLRIQEVSLKIKELGLEQQQLIRTAPFDGTVGSVFVELQEILAPYDKILNIYESKPSLIKAYTEENSAADLQIGQQVIVTSTNRSYEVSGAIESLGSRVTDYPARVNPNPNMNSYGQEVFIRISPDNRFLKGEKVYVYTVEE